MKKLMVLLLLLLITIPVQAATVHKWEYELSNACSKYVSTQYTPHDLYNCLIQESRDYFIWRHGWEQPVEGKVLGILTVYQPEILTLSNTEKLQLSNAYRSKVYNMYKNKMKQHPNLDANFTQADVERIWNAK